MTADVFQSGIRNAAMANKTVAKQVIETLRDLGVKHVFGVPSGGWVDYMEAMRTTDGIEFVLATHEGGAAFMADVCGRLTGAPGVCFGTFGPGATNLSTGVAGALLDRSPMIAFTDEMPPKLRGRTVQMAIDHQALFRPLTKKTTRLEANKVREILIDAAQVALSERRGPVHVGLPVGMSAEQAGDETIAPRKPTPPPAADAAKLAKMRDLLTKAKKPIIALGLGSVRPGVKENILKLAETHDIPIVITPMAKGMIPEDHRCYAGVVFHALSDVVGKTHAQADLVVAVGYDPVEFNFESWIPKAPVVAIDTEACDIDQTEYELAADVVGDVASSVAHLAAGDYGKKDWDMAALAERRQYMRDKMSPRSNTFGPTSALDVLREVLPKDGIMTCDVGAHTHLIGQKWPTPEAGLQIMTNGWSAMGFGVPSAIAAKICRPNQEVCTVVGDGGFLMTVGELAVAVRLNLKVVFVVLTDNDLALIRIKQEKKHNPIYGTPIRDKGNIGGDNLFGVPVLKAANADDFRAALKKAFAGDGPVIVEAMVNSREYDELVLKKDK